MFDYVKFFKKDVVTGKANKVGDKFVAFFLIGEMEFEVIEMYNGFFFAKAV